MFATTDGTCSRLRPHHKAPLLTALPRPLSAQRRRLQRAATGGLVVLLASEAASLGLTTSTATGVGVALLLTALAGSVVAWRLWRFLPRWALGSVVAVHLLALTVAPVWSDDIHRYVYEGRAVQDGLRVPYAVAPADGKVYVDDGVKGRVNHPQVPAAYPPTWQLTGGALAWLGDVVGKPYLPFRVLLLLCDLGIAGWLWRQGRRRRRGAWLWLLHPLPFVELAHGAHLDGLGVALLVASVVPWAASTSAWWRGALCGLGIAVKPVAAAALFAVAPSMRIRFAAAAALGCGLVVLPFVTADAPLMSGLSTYGARWEANPTGFALLRQPWRSTFEARADAGVYLHVHVTSSPFGLLVEEQGTTLMSAGAARMSQRKVLVDDRLVARLFALLLFALGVAWVWWRLPATSTRAALVCWLFFAVVPTTHPWYLLWPLALVASSSTLRHWSTWSTFAAAAVAPVTYVTVLRAQQTGVWQEAWWPQWLVVGAFVAPYAWSVLRTRCPEWLIADSGRGRARLATRE